MASSSTAARSLAGALRTRTCTPAWVPQRPSPATVAPCGLRSLTASSTSAFRSSSSSRSATVEDPSAAVPKKRIRRTKFQIEADRVAKEKAKAEAKAERERLRAEKAKAKAERAEAVKAEREKAALLDPRLRKRNPRVKLPYWKMKAEGTADMDAAILPESAAQADGALREFDHLPSKSEWREVFQTAKFLGTLYRYFAANRNTVDHLVSALDLDHERLQGNKYTIIEGYPGPGTITSELVKHPSVEKVVALEQAPAYLRGLDNLKSQLESRGEGSRLDIFKGSAYEWDTYSKLVGGGYLSHLQGKVPTTADTTVDFSNEAPIPPDHSDLSWQNESPIVFVAQLPNTVHGEQLFAQIIHAISNRLWLFRYGRIKMAFICGDSLPKRCLAPAGDRVNRCKLGTTLQCLADIEVHMDARALSPYENHFFPPNPSVGPRVLVSSTSQIPNSNPSTGLSRIGLCMLTVTPRKDPLIKAREIEAFEFITRNLFVTRSKSVGEALTHVAPGGQNVLRMMSQAKADEGLIKPEEVVEPDTKVMDLTNVQWACLARTFEKWPFRPEHLFEEGRSQRGKK